MQRWLRRVLPLVGGLLFTEMGCHNPSPEAAPQGPMAMFETRVSSETTLLLGRLGWSYAALPRGLWDEQGVPDPANPSAYLGVVTTLPNPFLASFGDEDFETAPVLVAVVDVETALPSGNPLGLTVGANCVFLQKNPTGPNQWRGAVSPASGGSCGAIGTPALPVADHPEAKKASWFTPSARVEFNEANNDLVVGVRCSDRWCNVGTATDLSLPSSVGGHPFSRRIKGRHDRQRLAAPSGSSLRATRIVATIVPDDDINARPLSYYTSGYRQAAVVNVEDPAGELGATKYGAAGTGKRWGFAVGDNIIGLRYDASANVWHVAVINGAGTVLHELKLVRRETHFGVPIPATARWLWSAADEIMWLPCSDGCCSVDAEI